MEAMRYGIVGVGKISDTFIDNTGKFKNLTLVGCTARNWEHITSKAGQYGIKPMTMDEMMGDASIELIMNLTPVEAHYEVIKRALEAGKHVYTEKTLTGDYTTSKELVDLAASKGLYIGCAPDTFLGSGVQTAAEAVADGFVGEVTGFTVMLNRGLDLLYEFVDFLLRPGAGMGYDFGIYALTAVLSMLGPVDEVAGFSQTNRPNRSYKLGLELPNFQSRVGQVYEIKNENIMAAVLRLKSGIIGTMMFNGDCVMPEQPYICIQGTGGTIYLPNPNEFGGEVRYQKAYTHPRQIMAGGEPERVLEVHHKFSDDSRGLGAAEMVSAIRESRKHRAHADMACHMLELLDGIIKSCDMHSFAKLNSTFDIPERLNGNEEF